MIVHECNSFEGIPYADFFSVNILWKATSTTSSYTLNSDGRKKRVFHGEYHIRILAECIFHKSTWLQSVIESNTKAELCTVLESWREYASKFVALPSEQTACINDPPSLFSEMQSQQTDVSILTAATEKRFLPSEIVSGSRPLDRSLLIRTLNATAERTDLGTQSAGNHAEDAGQGGDLSTDDEFYDCEEGEDAGDDEEDGCLASCNEGGRALWKTSKVLS